MAKKNNTRVVILCGGQGTRLTEETASIPKPMVEIGGKPILWHIMKTYSHYGFNEFILCLGYKGYVIKEYFSHYFLHMSDVTIDMKNNHTRIHTTTSEPWKVTLVDTGYDTMTGGRLLRIRKFLTKGTFLMTYGDGVTDLDIGKVLTQHKKAGKIATLSAVHNTGRFGVLDVQKDFSVRSFLEKPRGEESWINAGFFALEPDVLDYIDGEMTVWERGPLEKLAKSGQLAAYKHSGFWKCMDTLRDKIELERMWQAGNAPWKVW